MARTKIVVEEVLPIQEDRVKVGMTITKFDDNDKWMRARLGKITGSKLNGLIAKKGTEKKIGFYELIAERVGIPGDGEEPRQRGTRLEGEAIGFLEEMLGIEINTDKVLWAREDEPNMAISPDGTIDRERAVEVKCLGSAKHIKAFIEQEIPEEAYRMQSLQYFVVNEELQELLVTFYDPRIRCMPLFFLTVKREDNLDEIDMLIRQEKAIIAEVKTWVNKLTF